MKRTEVYCAVHRPILDLLKGIATQKPKPVTVSQEDCKQVYFLKKHCYVSGDIYLFTYLNYSKE